MFLVLGQNFGFQPIQLNGNIASGVLTTVDFFCVLLLMTTRVLSAGNHLIQQQRQDNGHREAEDQVQHVQQQRIDNGFGEITVLKNFFEDL